MRSPKDFKIMVNKDRRFKFQIKNEIYHCGKLSSMNLLVTLSNEITDLPILLN